MINNYIQISGLLKFEDPDDFYFVQILQRKKEHADLGNHSKVIKTYYIHTQEQLADIYQQIRLMCDMFVARAYIHLNRRNRRELALEMIALLAHNIKSYQYEGISKIYDKLCGMYHTEENPTWVVDVDSTEQETINNVVDTITELRDKYPQARRTTTHTYHIIKTKNGVHIITPGFHLLEFTERWGIAIAAKEIDIHKDNPTLLYMP